MFNSDLLRADALLYIFSIALQVSGALLLMINSMFNTKRQIISSYFEEDTSVIDKGEHFILRNVGKLENILLHIYLSRISCICIAIGYGIAIFGDISKTDSKGVLVLIAVCTVILMVLCSLACFLLVKLVRNFHCKVKRCKLKRGTKVKILYKTITDKDGKEIECIKQITIE